LKLKNIEVLEISNVEWYKIKNILLFMIL
jgi:hypothetical protein